MIWVRVFLTVFALIVLMPHDVAKAHHLVDKHQIDCNETFPCPVEIRRRVDFWVKVFRKWDTNHIVLHDSQRPERVYRVLRTEASCTKRGGSKTVDRERRKVRDQLRALAKKIDQGNKNWTEKELHLVALFPARKASHLRAASKRIRCQQGNADRFELALQRFGRYRALVRPIIKEAGLPDDIQYLPFVESAYNPEAYSRVGAAGLWQIMPRTGRSLGLKLNATIDERLDPERATWAAARYLSDATRRIESQARERDPTITRGELTPFVITSYNYGVAGMRRAIRAVGTDFVDVLNKHKSSSFQTAVKNFYASFLAARHVASNASEFFGDIAKQKPLRYDTVKLKVPTSIDRVRQVFSVDDDDLKPLNPALTRFVWHEWRYLPEGYELRLPDRKDNWKAARATLANLAPEDKLFAGTRYRVKRGDTACGIAHAFRVRCRDLIAANSLGTRAVIRKGQDLIIPGAKGGTRKASQRTATASTTHKVRRGDTACGVATRYGVSCRKLRRLNKLNKRGVIRIGQRLRIPGSGTTAATTTAKASLPKSIKVKKGDTPCGIARRYGVNCDRLLGTNGLNRKSLIRIGQRLNMPGEDARAVAASSAENSPAPPTPPVAKVTVVEGVVPGNARTAALDNDLDLRVRSEKVKGQQAWVIYVEPEETLGHYADWLGKTTALKLRKLNGIRSSKRVNFGKRIRLPVKTDAQRAAFEQAREDYHRVLVEQFKEHYQVSRLDEYTVANGDSAWKVASEYELPVWVVLRFNPELRRKSMMRAGQKLSVPVIKPVEVTDEPPIPDLQKVDDNSG